MTGASASTARSGSSFSSSRAASAIRIPARSRCSGLKAGERALRRLRVAHPHPYLKRPGAHVDREHVLAGEQPLQVLRARELRQRFVEAALAEAQHAAGVLEHDLGPRVGRDA